jgi:hypothetical protein
VFRQPAVDDVLVDVDSERRQIPEDEREPAKPNPRSRCKVMGLLL